MYYSVLSGGRSRQNPQAGTPAPLSHFISNAMAKAVAKHILMDSAHGHSRSRESGRAIAFEFIKYRHSRESRNPYSLVPRKLAKAARAPARGTPTGRPRLAGATLVIALSSHQSYDVGLLDSRFRGNDGMRRRPFRKCQHALVRSVCVEAHGCAPLQAIPAHVGNTAA